MKKYFSTLVILFMANAYGASFDIPSTSYLRSIDSLDDFEAISFEPGGVVRLGRSIKVLIDNRTVGKPSLYFLNANYCPSLSCRKRPSYATSHYAFARRNLSGVARGKTNFFNNSYYTVKDVNRSFYASRMQTYELKENGIKKRFYLVRFIERDKIHDDMIDKVMLILSKKMALTDGELAFASNSDTQKITKLVVKGSKSFTPAGFRFFKMKDLVRSVDYISLQKGEAYGYLRKNPLKPEELSPTDIALFDELPIDLAVVSGTITTVFQDIGSHVNLKALERGTPNMVIQSKEGIKRVKSFSEGAPIKLTVGASSFSIEMSTAKKVESFYRAKINKPWIKPAYEESSELKSFTDLCDPSVVSGAKCLLKAKHFGGKVTGLGFLARKDVVGMGSEVQQDLGYRLTPMGFGIPLSYYVDFVNYNTQIKPTDSSQRKKFKSEFKANLDKIVNTEMGKLGLVPMNNSKKHILISQIQEQFLQAKFPPKMYEKIYTKLVGLKKRVDGFYNVDLNKIKVRSSANVEDIEKFNGAGLHDSYAARISKSDPSKVLAKTCKIKLEVDGPVTKRKVKPKNMACAIKAVYASLWNFRAIQERSYRRFDHSAASMGIVVQTSYKFRKKTHPIIANSVLITRAVGTKTVYGYQISSQVNNGLVTNPVAGTRAELVHMTFQQSNFDESLSQNTIQSAKPEALKPTLKRSVMDFKMMKKHVVLARIIEYQYCLAKKSIYAPGRSCESILSSNSKPLALDMEFKVYQGTTEAEILVKQVRQFWGR